MATGGSAPGALTPRRTVTILQRRLVQYRVSLFEQLRTECDAVGIDLKVIYGEASPSDAKRNDAGALEWGDEVRSRWISVRGMELLWQRCPREARSSDLVVLTQENKILSNYPFLLARAVSRRRNRRLLAYWGHGRNLQSTNPDGLSERWKQLLLGQVDWWFAYNSHTSKILADGGFDQSRITSLENAIDNDAFIAELAAISDGTLEALRARIDLAPDAPLGLYCGALYADKRVDLLIEVADRIHRADPSFRLVVIGDGPVKADLDALVAERAWALTVGTQTGADKAGWFRLARVQLSPGAVGLHVLDSFAAGVPMFTTDNARHGPEIDYLEHGRNGFVVSDDPDAQAEAVLDLLADPSRYAEVVAAGKSDAGSYTLANMTANFVAGMVDCLERGAR